MKVHALLSLHIFLLYIIMELYTLVLIEVCQQGKAKEVMFITVGGVYTNRPTKDELFKEARNYIGNNSLTYRLIDVIYLTKEQYDSFLKGQITDYFRSE